MKRTLLLLFCGVMCLTGLAPQTASAATVVVVRRGGYHHHGRYSYHGRRYHHRRWVAGYYRGPRGTRVFVAGHYRYW